MKLKIVNVVGARPNFMKMAPLMMEYRRHSDDFDQTNGFETIANTPPTLTLTPRPRRRPRAFRPPVVRPATGYQPPAPGHGHGR